MMEDITKNRLLVISGNAFSNTGNNGKTIYSFIDFLPEDNVRQLYFRTETPEINGYDYYSLSDKAVLSRWYNKKSTGTIYSQNNIITKEKSKDGGNSTKRFWGVKRNSFTCLIREAIWHNHWLSRELLEWLDDFSPTCIFYVAGDAWFPYEICRFIKERYNAKLSVYITDDYILPRRKESIIDKTYRKGTLKRLKSILSVTDNFFTVSDMMQRTYKEVLGVDSIPIANMTDSLKTNTVRDQKSAITIVYAGSLYYKRDEIIGKVAQAAQRINSTTDKTLYIKVYSNTIPTDESESLFTIDNVCSYGGSLTHIELVEQLNAADILLFVESFDSEEIEKTRYSLSTKIPEYLSLEKPILAVGPEEVNSIQYLSDVALVVSDINEIYPQLLRLIEDNELKKIVSTEALAKFQARHNKAILQKLFAENVLL